MLSYLTTQQEEQQQVLYTIYIDKKSFSHLYVIEKSFTQQVFITTTLN